MGSGNIEILSEKEYGIIPRVMTEIFTYINSHSSDQQEFKVSCCYIEIYNDDIRDLLSGTVSETGTPINSHVKNQICCIFVGMS